MKRIQKYILILLVYFLLVDVHAQTGFPVNGPHHPTIGLYAYTHATIFVDYKTSISNADIVVEKGIIKQVGKNLAIPSNAIVVDLNGKFIYPSFIDLNTNYGIEPNRELGSQNPQLESQMKGAYGWNEALKSYQEAHKLLNHDPTKAMEYRNLGFGTVLAFQPDGVTRGTSTLVLLNNKKENESIVIQKAATHFSFDKGTSTQDYPGSLMGHIALLRQTLYDAQWYAKANPKMETNICLDAINATQNLPKIIETTDKWNVLRADKVGDEFGIQFIFKGSGNEYQHIPGISATKGQFILPLNFPQAYDVSDPIDAEQVTYRQLKHWEMAPFNPYLLWKAGIPFAFTSSDLKDRSQFLAAVKIAIRSGLPTSEALKALTYSPASMIKAENTLGALKAGMLANFIITSDSIFADGSTIYENVVAGDRFVIKDDTQPEIRGIYQLITSKKSIKEFPDTITLSISGKNNELEVEFLKDTVKAKGSITQTNDFINCSVEWNKKSFKFSGWKSKNKLAGKAELAGGESFNWEAMIDLPYQQPKVSDSTRNAQRKVRIKEDSIRRQIGQMIYPFNAFGDDTMPTAKRIVFKNATVWTSDEKGILKNTDVLIANGKIVKIGTITEKVDETIDATGKHITPGFIDEHSHIAIDGGVNECTHSITAEVRIGDVLNSENINIYRNLAGGVTALQALHGSCNCVGGQSAIIKLRWGKLPEELKIVGADGFIKFALGENVKQSNWGDIHRVRYPQTRMGVEQVYQDAFSRAREYETERKTNLQARRDLQLDALTEILNKKRFITCHSYVQSEISMLMQVADKFGFRVNTFTHILEGYKVADQMKTHGAGGSTFADWWAYKYEVKDAIPYNAAIMHKKGVLTAINSDDPEMSRRLNHEAAKTIKYGGVSEEDALKMITINPAKLLHIHTITGSITVGKDADIVLWSDHPLSVYAKCEQTYVDGVKLFDLKENDKKLQKIHQERIRIKAKMLEAKKNNQPTQKPFAVQEFLWDCEDQGAYYNYVDTY